MATRIQVRRDLKANWSSSLVLASGEVAYETDTGNLKVGDGSTQWSSLDYIAIASISTAQTDLNHGDYRQQGRFYLNTPSGSWTNLPSDMTAGDGESVLLVTRHMESSTAWFLQQLTQFVSSGSATKSWVRVYDSGAASYSAWQSTAHISPNEVVTASINNLAVTTGKIDDLAVTTAKIADLNVTTGKVADLGITTAKIADLNVTTGKIADSGVTTAKIANANVTSAKLETNISIAGTLAVASTTTFTGAPSYAADPASGNVLSRKTYVDDRTRIGAVAFVLVTNGVLTAQSTAGQFSIASSQLRGPAGQTWYAMTTFFNGSGSASFYGNVTDTSGPSILFGTVNAYTFVLVRTA